jgi:hypothetical protein
MGTYCAISRRISDPFKSLVESIQSHNPTLRPNVEEILNHPWMLDETPSCEEYLAEFERRRLIVNKIRDCEISVKPKRL